MVNFRWKGGGEPGPFHRKFTIKSATEWSHRCTLKGQKFFCKMADVKYITHRCILKIADLPLNFSNSLKLEPFTLQLDSWLYAHTWISRAVIARSLDHVKFPCSIIPTSGSTSQSDWEVVYESLIVEYTHIHPPPPKNSLVIYQRSLDTWKPISITQRTHYT